MNIDFNNLESYIGQVIRVEYKDYWKSFEGCAVEVRTKENGIKVLDLTTHDKKKTWGLVENVFEGSGRIITVLPEEDQIIWKIACNWR